MIFKCFRIWTIASITCRPKSFSAVHVCKFVVTTWMQACTGEGSLNVGIKKMSQWLGQLAAVAAPWHSFGQKHSSALVNKRNLSKNSMMQTTLHCLQGLQNLCLSFAAMFFVSWKPLRITRIKVNAGIPASPTVGYTGKAWQQPLWRPSTESEPAFSKSVAIFSLLTFSPKKSKHRESKNFLHRFKNFIWAEKINILKNRNVDFSNQLGPNILCKVFEADWFSDLSWLIDWLFNNG